MYILPDQILVNPEKKQLSFCFLVQVRLLTSPTLLRAFPWIPYILGFLIPSINWLSPLPMKFLLTKMSVMSFRAYGSVIYFENSRLLRIPAWTGRKFQEDTRWFFVRQKIETIEKSWIWLRIPFECYLILHIILQMSRVDQFLSFLKICWFKLRSVA